MKAPTDSVCWRQERAALGATAELNNAGRLEFKTEGSSPTNEQDALEVCARLVRKLNSEYVAWDEPIEGSNDVDYYTTSTRHPDRKLDMQVVRASASEKMWRTLGRTGHAEITLDAERAADELIAAVRKKSAKYPANQKIALTLVLDASRTPGHTFVQVVASFSRRHLQSCQSCGFDQVWLVGTHDELVFRLDAR